MTRNKGHALHPTSHSLAHVTSPGRLLLILLRLLLQRCDLTLYNQALLLATRVVQTKLERHFLHALQKKRKKKQMHSLNEPDTKIASSSPPAASAHISYISRSPTSPTHTSKSPKGPNQHHNDETSLTPSQHSACAAFPTDKSSNIGNC